MQALLAFLVPLLVMTVALLLEVVEARLLHARGLTGQQQPEPAASDEQPARRPQAASDSTPTTADPV